jgi:Xaa-Pro dipeptidase
LPSQLEIDRRYKNIRAAMEGAGLDALIVCGNQYAGFEGAVLYVSGFEIVHRYVYAVLPLEGEPTLVFPREARWIGDKIKPWVKDHVWPDVPGRWISDHARERRWKRVGVYGMNFIMAVRDYREFANGPFEMVPFDFEFDMARAVKSEEELAEVRDAMDIIVDGFWALVAAYEPGKTEAEIMAPAVERFFARGAGPRMMNILLSGGHGEAEASFKVPGHRVTAVDDLLLYSLEVTGAGGYWVEFSRPLIRGKLSPRTKAMADAYPEALEAARKLMRVGELAGSVHRVVAEAIYPAIASARPCSSILRSGRTAMCGFRRT